MVERLRQRSAKPVPVGSTPTHASIYEFKRLNRGAFFMPGTGGRGSFPLSENIQEMTAVMISVAEVQESEKRLNTGLL